MKSILLASLALLLSACGRPSVTFSLGGDPGRLVETTVVPDGEAKVALIEIRGTIVDSPRGGLFASGSNPVDDLVARLALAAKDPQVKAVVLRVNSPGGGVCATETMYNELVRFRETTHKPIVVSMSEVAASGGYYISLAADEIVAQPTSITGSIGVIVPTFNFSDGMKKLGIVSRSVKSAKNKDLTNPFEPMREHQYEVMQSMVDDFYDKFRDLVVERRNLDPSRIDELTDGRVFTGSQALAAGLIDHEGDLRDAFVRAKSLAGLPTASLIKYHDDAVRPRTPYGAEASIATNPATATPAGINFLNINLTGLNALDHDAAPVAYYLWTP